MLMFISSLLFEIIHSLKKIEICCFEEVIEPETSGCTEDSASQRELQVLVLAGLLAKWGWPVVCGWQGAQRGQG